MITGVSGGVTITGAVGCVGEADHVFITGATNGFSGVVIGGVVHVVVAHVFIVPVLIIQVVIVGVVMGISVLLL